MFVLLLPGSLLWVPISSLPPELVPQPPPPPPSASSFSPAADAEAGRALQCPRQPGEQEGGAGGSVSPARALPSSGRPEPSSAAALGRGGCQTGWRLPQPEQMVCWGVYGAVSDQGGAPHALYWLLRLKHRWNPRWFSQFWEEKARGEGPLPDGSVSLPQVRSGHGSS